MPESAAARPSRSPVVPGVVVRAEPSSSSLSSRRIGTVRAGVPTRIVQRLNFEFWQFRVSEFWLGQSWLATMARGAHWLSGGARRWLDDLAHAWWKRGMLARLRGDHRTSGGGREEVLVAEIERRTKSLEAVYLGNFAWMKGPSRDDEAASGGDARDASHVSNLSVR